MNFWVVKSKYNEVNREGWHWRVYLYEDCEGYDWGGEGWIRSKESQKYIREGVRKGDIIVCSQRGEGILGFTTLTGDGKDNPIGSGSYNTLCIAASTESFLLDPILPIPKLKETGCSPKCFMPGRMGTVFPLDKEEFKGIIDAIVRYYPEMSEDIINWLKRQGFEHQGEVPKPEDGVEFKVVKAEQTVASIPGEMPSIDDCILELFLVNQVGWADGELSPMEMKYFYKCIPLEIYDGVIEKWNGLEALWEPMSDDEFMKYYEEICQKARSKDETWKAKVIKNMIQIAKSDRRIYQEELSSIAEISDKIDAREECKRQLIKEFDWDPYGGADTKSEPEQREAMIKIAVEKKPAYNEFVSEHLVDKRPVLSAKDLQVADKEHTENVPYVSEVLTLEKTWDINLFRLPEEMRCIRTINESSGISKLQTLFPDEFSTEKLAQNVLPSVVEKDGYEITRKLRPDIIDTIGSAFRMFGCKDIKIGAYAIRNLEIGEGSFGDENAALFLENEIPNIVFIHNILETFKPEEIKGIVGHEIGHFLMGHAEQKMKLDPIKSALLKAKVEFKILDHHDDLRELYFYINVLPQLQELSADRIGLVVSGDLYDTIAGLIKMSSGAIGRDVIIDDYIERGKSRSTIWKEEDILRTHPYGTKRCWALKLFSESDLYHKVIGKEDGEPISEFSKKIAEIVPYPEENSDFKP